MRCITKNDLEDQYDYIDSKIAYKLAHHQEENIFNFNPEITTISHFFTKIFKRLFPKEKRVELENLQKEIASLMKERNLNFDEEKRGELEKQITDLRNKFLVKKQLKEKLKFTFVGFDISKKPIPHELFLYSEDVSEKDILDLLIFGYLNEQINALFHLTNVEMENISKKGKNRTPKEDINYRKIIALTDQVIKFITSCRSGADDKIKKDLLQTLKKMGNKEEKMYNLLYHLL